jgi:hypothetical protein
MFPSAHGRVVTVAICLLNDTVDVRGDRGAVFLTRIKPKAITEISRNWSHGYRIIYLAPNESQLLAFGESTLFSVILEIVLI